MDANHITFQGIDNSEYERFIKDIRKRARNAGKSRDNDWIIDLVSNYITGPALRWYVQLDPDISEDWGKLQIAMIDRWSESGPIGEGRASSDILPSLPPLAPPPENIPAPAPASAPAPAPSIIAAMSSLNLDETKIGRIRVNCPGSETMYIPSSLTQVFGSMVFTTCNDKSKALNVEITQGCVHHPREIKLLNSPDRRKFLGIAQEGRGRLGEGSTEQALLVTTDWAGSSAPRAAVLRTEVWSLCPFDSTIRALWQADGSEFLLKPILSNATKRIIFVSNVAAYRAVNQKAKYPEVPQQELPPQPPPEPTETHSNQPKQILQTSPQTNQLPQSSPANKPMQFHDFFARAFNGWLVMRGLTLEPPRVDGRGVELHKLFPMVGALGGCRARLAIAQFPLRKQQQPHRLLGAGLQQTPQMDQTLDAAQQNEALVQNQPDMASPPQTRETQPQATVLLLPGLSVHLGQIDEAQMKIRAAIGRFHDKRSNYSSINLSHEQGILLEQSIHHVVLVSAQAEILHEEPEKRLIFGLGDLNTYRNHLTTFLMGVNSLQGQAIALQN
ncbi:hypothetical protein M407DRAFT_33915 [Tulasnella calospora MUT 4182]|uniref:Uncharacterized protein n=1 Tax=Tulasnella calospora MUT 4182 TaxID=1051891 RepID=A0A0C3Q1I9_9AGAM|nr:hypothetical protein M407DRAFT_33915 [Tulasnella calospora MUT 4182]